MTPEIFLSLLAATVQSGMPILYATLGEILTEKGWRKGNQGSCQRTFRRC